MANTQNLDLVKPIGTDHALISDLNGNSDKIDAYAGKVNTGLDGLRDGIAILADGNTHAAITSGQFVYVKNHQTLPEGLYQASANIAANAALSTSNLTADAKGGLNSLSEQIESKIGNYKFIDGGTNPSNWNNAYADTFNTIIMYSIAESQLPTGAPSGAYTYGTLIAITKSAQSGWEFSRNLIYIEAEHSPDKKDVYFSAQGGSWYKISGTKVNTIA